MKRIICLPLIIILYACSPGDRADVNKRDIIDMAGRHLLIPEKVNKVFSANPNGTILLYTLDPELLAGWNRQLPKESANFVPEKYRAMPHYGQIYGKSISASEEEIIKLAPDFIICMWPIEKKMIKAVENLEKRLQIPIVILDSSLEKIPEVYRLLGKLTGKKQRAAILAGCSKRIIDKAMKISLSHTYQPVFYYSFSKDGLTTISGDSVYMDVFKLCGLRSIEGINSPQKTYRTKINIEQLLLADPDYILIGDNSPNENLPGKFIKDKKWQMLKAVKNKRIYSVPAVPFNWIDKPPSVNRLPGILWLLWVFYPESSKGTFFTEIKNFYREFYHVHIKIDTVHDGLHMEPMGFIDVVN